MLRADGRRRLDRLLGLWDHLVDRKVGIVQRIDELPVDEDDPNFFHYLSKACNTSRFTPLRNFANNGGVSTDRFVALAKALGEAVERYCSAIFLRKELLLAPYSSLETRATPPEQFALYRPEQLEEPGFAWRPFTADSPVYWARGRSLLSGEEVLVPAAMVYVPFHFGSPEVDTAFVQPISTGLACGSSFTEAALSGLCEVVERDAFTIMWQASMSRPRIRPQTVPASGRDLLRRYTEVGLDVKLVDITTDFGVPTILTIAVSAAATSPALAFAAAADPSAEIALIKSLEELAHTRKFAKQLMEFTPPVPVEPGHPKIVDQRDHLRFYCPQSSKAFAEFTWSSPELKDFRDVADRSAGDPGSQLADLVAELDAAGFDPVACDLTTPDIAGLGLSVVRVVVPGLHPLYMGYRIRATGGRRLYEVPQKLGAPGLEPGQPDNPYPHPFP